jgi:hypothetical protein
MLAMEVQAPRAIKQPASSLTSIASKLAPTGVGVTRALRSSVKTASGRHYWCV